MIFRQTPKNKNLFILVDDKTTAYLSLKGFTPMYIDKNGVYYKKTKELIDFMEKEGIKIVTSE